MRSRAHDLSPDRLAWLSLRIAAGSATLAVLTGGGIAFAIMSYDAVWSLSRAGIVWRLGWCAAGIAGNGDRAVTPVALLSNLRLGLTPEVNALGALVVLGVGSMLALALWLLRRRQA